MMFYLLLQAFYHENVKVFDYLTSQIILDQFLQILDILYINYTYLPLPTIYNSIF